MIPQNDFPLSGLVRKMQIFTKEVNSYALDFTFFLTDNLLDLPLIFLLWYSFLYRLLINTYGPSALFSIHEDSNHTSIRLLNLYTVFTSVSH